MNIAVVDDGNNLVAFERMDGAWLGSVDIAQGKAYTARAFDMSTKDLAPLCQPGESLFGIHASNGGRLIVFPGGIPLEKRRGSGRRDRGEWGCGRAGSRRCAGRAEAKRERFSKQIRYTRGTRKWLSISH